MRALRCRAQKFLLSYTVAHSSSSNVIKIKSYARGEGGYYSRWPTPIDCNVTQLSAPVASANGCLHRTQDRQPNKKRIRRRRRRKPTTKRKSDALFYTHSYIYVFCRDLSIILRVALEKSLRNYILLAQNCFYSACHISRRCREERAFLS